MEESRSLAPLLLVVGLAFLVPLVLARLPRLRLPVVVGEIMAGIIIGRSGFQLVYEDPTLEVLAALGFAFLMFLSGLEIDFSMLAAVGKNIGSRFANPVFIGLAILALTLVGALSFAVGLSILGLVASPWLLALILSTTSLGIVLPVLRERGLSSTLFGQTILLAALIADFVTMVLITVVVALMSGGLTLEVLLVGVLLVVFFLAARFARRFTNWQPVRRTLAELTHATVQIKVRGALAVMFGFVVLSEVLGAEVILGAFLAGALIALIASPEDVRDMEAQHKLDAIGFGFIVPIFFIMVGVRFDLPALLASPSDLILFPLLLLAAYVVKLAPALILKRTYTWRQSLAAGLLLSSRLSLIVAASAIGLKLGIISEALNADIVLVAIVTSTVSPALFGRFLPALRERPLRPLVIVGAGHMGILLAQRMTSHEQPFIVIDSDQAKVMRMRHMDYPVIEADPASRVGLAKAGGEKARGLVATTSDDDFNLAVCRLARSTFGIEHIVAYVQDASRIREFETAGARAVNPGLASAAVLDALLRLPDAYGLLTTLEDDKEVMEAQIRNSSCVGHELRQMRLPGDVLVLAIRRNGELFVPHGRNRLERNDHVTLLGSLPAVRNAVHWLEGSNSRDQ